MQQPVLSIQQLPTAPDFIEDPYAFYRKARALGDFVFWEDYQVVMATSFEAVSAVVTSAAMGREPPPELRASRPAHLSAYHKIDDHSLLRLESPEHARLRTVAVSALSDEIIHIMAPTVSQICDTLIDAFPQDSPFDLQSTFADKVPGITLMRLLGLPDDMLEQVQKWARDVDGLFHARRDRSIEDAAETAAHEFTEFMQDHLSKLRSGPETEGFLGRIVGSYNTLADEEIIALALLILQAGTGATAYALGTAIYTISDHPERKLALTPDQIEATVSECLRFRTPFHIMRRYAQEDVTLLETSFSRHTQIGCLIGSACHDDAVWPDGNKFDPFRALRPHLGLGAGVHACIGKSLTHMIMKIALPSLFSRCPSLRVVRKPQYANDYMFRHLVSLDAQI